MVIPRNSLNGEASSCLLSIFFVSLLWTSFTLSNLAFTYPRALNALIMRTPCTASSKWLSNLPNNLCDTSAPERKALVILPIQNTDIGKVNKATSVRRGLI